MGKYAIDQKFGINDANWVFSGPDSMELIGDSANKTLVIDTLLVHATDAGSVIFTSNGEVKFTPFYYSGEFAVVLDEPYSKMPRGKGISVEVAAAVGQTTAIMLAWHWE